MIPYNIIRVLLEFYRRLEAVHNLLQDSYGIHLRNKAKDNRPFIQLNKLLEEVLSNRDLCKAVSAITKKAKVFDKLREALRIELKKLIKQLDLPQKISEIFSGQRNFNTNCHLRT